jgi:hypothetical protein
MLPALQRQTDVVEMIEGKYYFTVHSPWQSGKTTYLQNISEIINAEGRRHAFVCPVAGLENITDRREAMALLSARINRALRLSPVKALNALSFPDDALPQSEPSVKISNFLNYLSVSLDKDLAVFFDDVDCMEPGPLVTFLAQIRDCYNERHLGPKSKFPGSVVLAGMRGIRDCLTRDRPEDASRFPAGPFNIEKGSLTLADFTEKETGDLYRQHTEAGGQAFDEKAVARAWRWSEGQPGLVNALAFEAAEKILKDDCSRPVTAEIIDQAARAVILNRSVHVDRLRDRLKEPRVRRVTDAVVAGAPFFGEGTSDDDIRYVLDLGLLKSENEVFRPSNPIYGEIISRTLSGR